VTASRHAAASDEALALWDAASDTGQSGYLDRKGVQGYGVRFTADGVLLVPLRDAAGILWNVQTIAPQKPFNGTDKLFQKGGRKSGLWHMVRRSVGRCGAIGGGGIRHGRKPAPGHGPPCALWRLTLATWHALPKPLHLAHPAALIVLCGDDDADTHARTGHNPGRDKATAAARAVQGLAVFPEGLPAGASDFNDMHAAAGLDAVRAW
jgi:putative DNA primase/helicase